jgi:hypothetical protein
MIYSISLATAGDLTTNATPGTETDAFFIKAGSGRSAYLQSVQMLGKAAALTALSGIVMRIIKFTTASTAGTGITPTPKDPGMQAAKATSASRPTAGTTRVNRVITGCGAGSLGGWIAPNPDSYEVLEAGGALSIDGMDASNTASLKYEFSAEFQE